MNRQTLCLVKRLKLQASTKQYICNNVLHHNIFVTSTVTAFQVRYLSTHNAEPPPKSVLPPLKDSWFDQQMMNIRTRLGMAPRPKPHYRLRGLMLFQCAEQVRWQDYFKVFQMPDTFHSWFLVIELHMWMLSVRLNTEGQEGELLKKFAIEYMWAESLKRSKKLRTTSSAIRDSFDIIHEEFLAAFVLYDYGLLTSDVALAEVLWHRFFNEKCDDPEKVELLVKHVRHQMQILEKTPREDFVDRASFSWLPLGEKL